jgi:hypothetical protein
LESERELLVKAYRYFNVRNIEAVLLLMHTDVEWPNGMEGGTVYGRDGVREYWTRQCKIVDPHVQPTGFRNEADGRIVVEVRQVVRDLVGQELLNRKIEHVYRIEDGLIQSMEIREIPQV